MMLMIFFFVSKQIDIIMTRKAFRDSDVIMSDLHHCGKTRWAYISVEMEPRLNADCLSKLSYPMIDMNI